MALVGGPEHSPNSPAETGALGLYLAPASARGPGKCESLEQTREATVLWELEVSTNIWDNWRRVKRALLEAVGLEWKGKQWEAPVVAVLGDLEVLIISGLLKQMTMACSDRQ